MDNNKKKKFTKNSKRFSNSSGSTIKSKNISEFSVQLNNDLYLSDKYSLESVDSLKKINLIKKCFSSLNKEALVEVDKYKKFVLNVEEFGRRESICSHWSNFKDELENNPDYVMNMFGLALEQLIQKSNIRKLWDSLTEINGSFYCTRKKINTRFVGFRNLLSFQDLMALNYGKFVSIMGIVVRTGPIKPFCTDLTFQCIKCHLVQVCHQDKGCYTSPTRCVGTECFSCSFKPLLSCSLTKTIPFKAIRIQELTMNQNEGGCIPKSIECELTCDLTEKCNPGDIVIISGIVGLNNIKDKKAAASKDACTYDLFLNANSVICLKGKNVDTAGLKDAVHLKDEDQGKMRQISEMNNLFRLVVLSLSPNIYGHELVKAGIILTLFSGKDYDTGDVSQQFVTRDNSHLLVVGDPGLGKSQMLLASSNVSPRGVYVCGNSTTTSGLTVTISKGGGGENSLEAGALVLADQGHCCIDEFDKMAAQHSALLEAMEQQTISIAKSGVVCTLPSRTSIIAAANPSGGHYNRSKTVAENLRINGALLSRFDLVFILQDRPDQGFDSRMTDHVMAVHNKNNNNTITDYFAKSQAFHNITTNPSTLLKKLQIRKNEKLNYIPHKLLQKYISYSRKFSDPELSSEVRKILQNFYLDMRRQHKLSSSMPITTRQLESLIRLTKARARIELRKICTKTDAEEVIEIMKFSMLDTFSDEFGNLDLERSIQGSGMSKRSQGKKFISMLTRAATTKGDDCFHISEMKDLAIKMNIKPENVSNLIEMLNDQGFLLKKGFQLYQIQTI